MNKSQLQFLSKCSVIVLCIIGLIEFGFGLWSVVDQRYKTLAYTLVDVGYIDLWVLRYLSLCLFVSSIITLVMCLILIWGLYSAHIFLFIATTMIVFIIIGEFTISILTFTSKYETRITLLEQLPKLVITYRQGTDERAKRALDKLQSTFHCCGAEGRLSYQNNVPLSCNMFSIGCLTRTMYFLDIWMDALAYMLLFFSIVKLLIVLFFYSFICLYQRYRQNYMRNHRNLINDSVLWEHTSPAENTGGDSLSKKGLLSSTTTNNNQNDYAEQNRYMTNDYEITSSNPRLPTTSIVYLPSSSTVNNNNNIHNGLAISYEPYASRKLSSISERTEKSETDESETDIAWLKNHTPQRKAIITSIPQKQHSPPLPRQLPVIKTRKKLIREDDNDSGVERSSSEKSFDDQKTTKSKPPINNKSPNPLGFSNVFITSLSQGQTKEEELQKPLAKSSITTTSSMLPDYLPSSDIVMPKPILKKSSPHSSPDRILIHFQDKTKPSSTYAPLFHNIPKPIPRSTIKQTQQDESLV